MERLAWNKLINMGVLVFAPKERLPYLLQKEEAAEQLHRLEEMWARSRTEGNVPPTPQVCPRCGGYYWAECPCTGHERVEER